MSGLVLTLAPGESFLVNGVLLENGDRPSRIRVKARDARVLRCSDAMRPEAVNTPVKQVYFAVQLLITGDLDVNETMPALLREANALADVFSTLNAGMIPKLKEMLSRGNYYSALNHIKSIIALESEVLSCAPTTSNRQVA